MDGDDVLDGAHPLAVLERLQDLVPVATPAEWADSLTQLTEGERVEAFGLLQRTISWTTWAAGALAAGALDAAGALVLDEAAAGQAPQSPDGVSDDRWLHLRADWARSAVVEDLAGTSGLSPAGVWRRINRSRDLAAALPGLDALAATGRVDHVKCDIALDVAGELPPEALRRIDAVLVGAPDPAPPGSRPLRPLPAPVEELPPARLREMLTRRVARLAPDDAADKHARAKATASAHLTPTRDGMARLVFTGTATDLALVKTALDALAAEGHDPVQTLVSWATHALHGVDPVPGSAFTRPHLVVTVPLSSLTGEDDAPGELHGFGPIPADLVRDLARRATLRCAGTDHDGTLVSVGERTWSPPYTPPPTLRRFLVVADPRCTFPGCGRAALKGQLDHLQPWPEGSTCTHNLAPYCVHHHNLKTHTAWRSERDATTSGVRWRTPTDAIRVVPPGLWETTDPAPRDDR